ncbi:hypothetical protein [Clostridium sp.]|uniref:hypothetical protein n=1 Tax=Clostridium sp. TaxID=1506 RepID=UPI00262201C7|nr:hypothetical protein [Clostridium sp.]
MRIYRISGVEGFIEFQLNEYDTDSEYLDLLNEDKSIAERWKILDVGIVTKGKKSDCPFFWGGTDLVVISEEARTELLDLFNQEKVELLPLKNQDKNYYMVHVMETQNVGFSPDEIDCEKIIFNEKECNEQNIVDKYIFRGYFLGKRADSSIFVTDRFIDRIKNSKLKGFNFVKIWEG